MKKLLLVVIFLATPAAASITPNLSLTSGSEGYRGSSLSLNWKTTIKEEGPLNGWVFHLKPGSRSYRTDTSSGTFRTFSLEAGLENTFSHVNFTGSSSPEVNGYRNHAVGLEGALHYPPRSEKEDHPVQVELTLGFLSTTHTDEFQVVRSTLTSKGRSPVRKRTNAINIQQNDGTVGIEFILHDWSLSAQATHSSYDQDLEAIQARSAQIESLAGLNTLVQGFPESSVTSRVECDALPLVSPYVSYTRTKFKLDAPEIKAVTVGATISIKKFDVEASYENDHQANGEPTLNYVTVSGS